MAPSSGWHGRISEHAALAYAWLHQIRAQAPVSAALLAEARHAFASGNSARAFTLAQQLVVINPADVAALSVLANAAMRLEQLDEADAALGTLLRLRPADAAIARSRSRVLNRLGHRSEQQTELAAALGFWREALQLWPDNDDAAFNLALHGTATLDDEEAVSLLQRVLSRSPEDLGARLSLAQLERDRGQAATAVEQLRQLSDADLRDRKARSLVLTLGDAELIERSLPEALDLSEQVDAAHSAFAALSTLHSPHAADALYHTLEKRQLIGARSPGLRIALARNLSLPSIHADMGSIENARSQFADGLTRLENDFPAQRLRRCEPRLAQLNWSNFLLAYQCENDLPLQSRYGDWLCMAAAALRPDLAHPFAARKSGPARIGLMSGHWNNTTAGAYFASWIEALDSAEFDTRIYALGPRFDEVTDELARGSRCFVRLDGDIDAAAETLRAADLDLLIYPELGMDTRLLPIAALRLARRQWSAWGHPVTTGLATIDNYLSCADMEPPDAATHYRERLLLLPGLGTRYRLPPKPERQSREALGLPAGRLVVIPQSLFKIHPDNDQVLLELLSRRPDTRVLLFTSTSRLEARLLSQRLHTRLGSTLFRKLHFQPMVSRRRFLEILAAADLMLDTVHWSGGNTSLDALRAGLAIATTRSRFMRGRQSAAMLQALGIDQAIAAHAGQLAELACEMLRHPIAAPAPAQLEAYLQSERPLEELRTLAHEAVTGVV